MAKQAHRPTAWIFTVGDTRFTPEHWIIGAYLAAIKFLEPLLKKAGFESRVISYNLLQSQAAVVNEMRGVVQHCGKGDILIPLCIGWGLPGFINAALMVLKNELISGKLKLHFVSNLLAQYPGYVLTAAAAQWAEMAGLNYTREIVLNWNDPGIVKRLIELRTTGTIQRQFNDSGPGSVSIADSDLTQAQRVADRLAGSVIGTIGGSSMLMGQGYIDHRLLRQLRVLVQDIGHEEFLHIADRIHEGRARAALHFCQTKGLQIAPDVPESMMLRAMQYLLAFHQLRDLYKLVALGVQGQFDLTDYHISDDLSVALANGLCQPEGNGLALVTATENDFFAELTMLLMQLAVAVKFGIEGDPIGFHDLRHIVEYFKDKATWLIVLLNSGALNARDLTGRNDSLAGMTVMLQNYGYFLGGGPTSGGIMQPLSKLDLRAKTGLDSADRVGTWARLFPRGDIYCLQAGHFRLVELTPEQRLEHYGELDLNWPFGLAEMFCDPWRFLYNHVPNHTHTTPYDILSLLAAFASVMGWEFRPMGVKS